ncbi:MAG: DUF1800 family protein, partial [Planctomycetes bacterium]|nr:DUF1800 family protein [Planctomycetota bacterium]
MRSWCSILLLSLILMGCGGGGGGSGGTTPVNPNPTPLTITTNSLDQAQVDVPYLVTIQAAGGAGSGYTYSISPDTPQFLPHPLELDGSTGVISGTPLPGSNGAYVLRIRAFDGFTNVFKTLSVVVNQRLAIATTIVPNAVEGTVYTAQLAAVGGFAGKTWSVDPALDQLPAGLTLSATGTISGTPTSVASGEYTVRFSVTDGTITSTHDISMTVLDPALSIDALNLPQGQAGAAYPAQTFTATGGSGNNVWDLSPQTSAQLPNGLNLSAGGVLSGTPAIGTDGFHNVLIRCTADGVIAEREFVIQIGNPPMEIVSSSLSEAEIAVSINMALVAGGGTPPYSWSLAPTSAPLPQGINLSSTGVLSGTPLPGQAGMHSFTLRLQDSASPTPNISQKLVSWMIREADLLDVKYEFTQANIAHFLTRTQFGVTEEAVAAVTAAGSFENYVDQMLNKSATPSIISSALSSEVSNPMFPTSTQLSRYWQRIMVNSDAPFQETMALFWHDHFATGYGVLGQTNLYYHIDHIAALRSGALGSFSQLLFDVAIDKHMLVWLDGIRSTRNAPNENFARELWELFTLGVDNGYTQQDIEVASRVFTGFRQSFNGTNNVINFNQNLHDVNDKVLWGKTIKGRSGPDAYLEYMDVIDLTLAERPAAEFICTKLWEWFSYKNPEQEIIDGLAATLRANNWEIKPMLKQMFLSNAFYASEGVKPRAKSPIEYAVGLMRSSQLDVPINRFDSFLILAGHRPGDPPDVSGWPSDEQWMSADAMIQRANFAALVRNE